MNQEQKQRITSHFVAEAKDLLAVIDSGLSSLSGGLIETEAINELFRAAHSIKGGAAMLDLPIVTQIAYHLEDYFKVLQEYAGMNLGCDLGDALRQVYDCLVKAIAHVEIHLTIEHQFDWDLGLEVDPRYDLAEQLLATWVQGVGQTMPQIGSSADLSFSDSAMAKLDEMEQIFKREDVHATRLRLQGICDDLGMLGAGISGWRELTAAAAAAVGNLGNSYRTLAPVILRSLRSGTDLVNQARLAEIGVTAEIKSLLPANYQPKVMEVVKASELPEIEPLSLELDKKASPNNLQEFFAEAEDLDLLGMVEIEDGESQAEFWQSLEEIEEDQQAIELESPELLQEPELEVIDLENPELLQESELEIIELESPELLQEPELEIIELESPELLQEPEPEVIELESPELLQEPELEVIDLENPELLQESELEIIELENPELPDTEQLNPGFVATEIAIVPEDLAEFFAGDSLSLEEEQLAMAEFRIDPVSEDQLLSRATPSGDPDPSVINTYDYEDLGLSSFFLEAVAVDQSEQELNLVEFVEGIQPNAESAPDQDFVIDLFDQMEITENPSQSESNFALANLFAAEEIIFMPEPEHPTELDNLFAEQVLENPTEVESLFKEINSTADSPEQGMATVTEPQSPIDLTDFFAAELGETVEPELIDLESVPSGSASLEPDLTESNLAEFEAELESMFELEGDDPEAADIFALSTDSPEQDPVAEDEIKEISSFFDQIQDPQLVLDPPDLEIDPSTELDFNPSSDLSEDFGLAEFFGSIDPSSEELPNLFEPEATEVAEPLESNPIDSLFDFGDVDHAPSSTVDHLADFFQADQESQNIDSNNSDSTSDPLFDELESLLSKPMAAPNFADLEALIGASQPAELEAKPRLELAPKKTRVVTTNTMKVNVKNLDSLNNLVGELIVNRNLLESDNDKLQLFISNLLHQVQDLSDVSQRMRDEYDRSLMESTISMSRPQSFTRVASSLSEITAISGGESTTALFEDIELDRYSNFHILSQEIIELIVKVRESASDIEFVVSEAEQVTRQLGTITTQIQDDLKQVRMVPFDQMAERLPRGVRDRAQQNGKKADIVVFGGDTLIDKAILEQLQDPMVHLINNAIDHGIEDPLTRSQAGKPEQGTITVRAYHQGNQTVIAVTDDGAGINPAKVAQSAIRKGLRTENEVKSLTVEQTYDLLFEPGFSTTVQADVFKGRGVGMDVVKSSIEDIRGTVYTESKVGEGTTFTIRLPLTLSVSKAMFCISDRNRIAFPVDGFEDVVEISGADVEFNSKGQPCLPWRDTILPFRPLTELLSYNRQISRSSIYNKQEDDLITIVILRNEGNYLALQVDQFLGENEIVIKNLEGPIEKPKGIAGATILGDGRVMSIANILELFDIASGKIQVNRQKMVGSLLIEDDAQSEPLVLIIDDSVTVRELLSLTFSKIGYRVEQARDGQDAWEKLRAGLPCDLIFCDVEMPRMDGFELLSRIQKDNSLNRIPVSMLTSRGSQVHRQRAAQLGAKAYFTKPYLEEEILSGAQKLFKGEKLID
ncbi:MAG: response regulator [Pseudanabaenaceae cyanobacterium bins.68]|nr:response regulator [Pseudanabaenaceae cyanobacterium bins.68]